MKGSRWFAVWVFTITALIISLFTIIVTDSFGITDTIVQFSQSKKFQALKVLGVGVTLLSGLLALYGFFWFVKYTVYNPVYYRLPSWLYCNVRLFNAAKKEFDDQYKLVFLLHQRLLLNKIVIEPYSQALQKNNYGVEIILVDNVKFALIDAIEACYGTKSSTSFKLQSVVTELFTGVGQTIELSKVYRIQLWILIANNYIPTQPQLQSAYKYLTLKHAYMSTVHGGEMKPSELIKIKQSLKVCLPTDTSNKVSFEQNGLSANRLYTFVQTFLEEYNEL